jgi:hypothetical protein
VIVADAMTAINWAIRGRFAEIPQSVESSRLPPRGRGETPVVAESPHLLSAIGDSGLRGMP